MNLAPGEVPYKPCINCTKCKLTLFSQLTCTFNIIQDPPDLCCGKICIDYESCFVLNCLCVIFLEGIAEISRSPVLPHDCLVNGFPRFPVPYNCCLPLVCNADCSDIPA